MSPRTGGTTPVNIPGRYPPWTDPPLPTGPVQTTPGGDRTVQSGAGLRTAALVGPGHRIPILYGRCLITPDIVRMGMANYRAEFEVVISEGPIDAVEDWLTDSGTFEVLTVSLGSMSAPASGLHGTVGLAAAYIQTKAGRPYQPRCLARGRKLYDPRLGAWGAGAYPDAAKTAYSKNPALVMADLVCFPQYGLGVSPTLVDWTSVEDAADWCDELVGGAKRYEINLYMQAAESADLWLDTIGLHAGLRWREEGGLWRLDFSAPVTTAADPITDDHVVQGTAPRLVYGSGAGLADRPNRFRAEWIDPASGWVVRTVEVRHPEVDAGAAVRDAQVYKFHGFQSEAMALRALWRVAHEIWSEVELECELTSERIDLLEGSRVPVTLSCLGLAGVDFLVTRTSYDTDRVTIAARRYDVDTWDPPAATGEALDDPGFFDTPPALANAELKLRTDVTVEGATTKTRNRPGVLYDLVTFAFAKQLRIRCASSQNTPGGVAWVNVVSEGSGYAVNDTVAISGEGSSAAAKVLTVDGSGKILTVQVTAAGSGYWPQTTFASAGGSGTGAILSVGIASTTDVSTLTWDDEEMTRNEFTAPFGGNETQTNAAKAWAVIGSLVASFDDTTDGDFFNGGSASGVRHPMRVIARLESLAGLLGPASTFDQTGASYSSTTANPVEPVYHLSDLTANAIPKANTSGGGRLVDSKLVDTGSDLLYDGTSLLGGGKVMRAQEYTSGTTTWTAPTGVTEIWVTACAGGGGSGRSYATYNATAGGGGGASVYRKRLVVTGGTGYSVTVGGGGTGSTGVSAGGTGGTTSIGALLSLSGGTGSTQCNAGATTSTPGSAGGDGGTAGQYASGTATGIGGISCPGGYGSGAPGSYNANGRNGSPGYVLIEWNE